MSTNFFKDPAVGLHIVEFNQKSSPSSWQTSGSELFLKLKILFLEDAVKPRTDFNFKLIGDFLFLTAVAFWSLHPLVSVRQNE